MLQKNQSLMWFRRDLRLNDNPALNAAIKNGPVTAIYILDEESDYVRPLGGAQKVWLNHSLISLQKSLKKHGIPIILRRGKAEDILTKIVNESKASVFWNRCYDKGSIARDKKIKEALNAETFNGSLLNEPWEIKSNSTGEYYKVYTPYWKAMQAADAPPKPQPLQKDITPGCLNLDSDSLEEWKLLPTHPNWSDGITDSWQNFGETAAQKRLDDFLGEKVNDYKENRNRPDIKGTSLLSPHLHFGEISPRQVWHQTKAMQGNSLTKDAYTFLSELVWREFCYTVLFYNPDLATKNYQQKFDAFPWVKDDTALEKWQRGKTGFPIIDAAMRQLWHTGWMHNRCRMIVGSFLVKDLLIDWRYGEQWFWDTLVDADHANNTAGWQWVAGCGTDAAPYFRIFNPITQSEKFDPNGDYIRRWVPELTKLSDKYLHKPWEASDDEIKKAEVILGETYPKPIVNHKQRREQALEIFSNLSG